VAIAQVEVGDAGPLVTEVRCAVASVTHVATFTDSSPRFVRTTSPLTPTQSPKCSFVNSSNSDVTTPARRADLAAGVTHRGEGQLALAP